MENAPKVFKLTADDVHSHLWLRLSGHINEEIGVLRERLESLSVTEKEADHLRGMIAALKNLLHKV